MFNLFSNRFKHFKDFIQTSDHGPYHRTSDLTIGPIQKPLGYCLIEIQRKKNPFHNSSDILQHVQVDIQWRKSTKKLLHTFQYTSNQAGLPLYQVKDVSFLLYEVAIIRFCARDVSNSVVLSAIIVSGRGKVIRVIVITRGLQLAKWTI